MGAGNNFSSVIVRNESTGKLETICLDTGEVITSSFDITDMSKYKFNFDMALNICQKIREGTTLKSIGDDPELPDLPVIHFWRRNNASFDEEIKLARKERAEYYHDKVIELADTVKERDDVPVAKFRTDQYKWAAEKGDPSSYGSKVELSGEVAPSRLIIVTGIKRDRPDVEVTDYEEVQDTGREDESDEGSVGGRVLEYSEGEGSEAERREDSTGSTGIPEDEEGKKQEPES